MFNINEFLEKSNPLDGLYRFNKIKGASKDFKDSKIKLKIMEDNLFIYF